MSELPRGLEEKESDWIILRTPSGEPVAPIDTAKVRGRSVTSVLFRHAGGRKAALDYLERLRTFTPAWLAATNSNSNQFEPRWNPELPQFPNGAQWAMVRRMMVIDSEGQ